MKLRYFKDDYIYFKILGVDTPTGLRKLTKLPERDTVHKTLKEATVCMLHNIGLQRELDDIFKEDKYGNLNYSVVVLMNEVSSKRTSESNNILYFCESALFKLDRHLKCSAVIFNFRKTIDPLLESAHIYYMGESTLYYDDHTVIAGDYFKFQTPDRELAEFVLNNHNAIVY